MSLSRDFAAFVASLRYADLPSRGGRPRQGRHPRGADVRARRARDASVKTGARADAGRGTGRCRHRHRIVLRREAHQGRRGVRQRRDDPGRRQVGHLPHAHPPGNRHHPRRACRRGGHRRIGPAVPHRGRRGLRGHGTHGRRVHPDGDVARLPRRPGVRHLRRRGRRGETTRAQRRPDPQRHCPVRQSRRRQSRRRAQRRPVAARGRRRAQRACWPSPWRGTARQVARPR